MTIKQYKKIFSVTAKIIIVIVFFICATYVILNAAGYKIIISRRSIVQTSMIVIKALPKGVILTVDGAVQNNTLSSWRVSGLQPGNHEIEIKKAAYNKWTKSLYIEPGQSAIYENISLFLDEPTITTIGEDIDSNLVTKLNQTKKGERIAIINNEISLDGVLVTRLSTSLTNPQIFPDNYHISYIADNYLHIIDIDGTNDNKILAIPNDSQYIFLDGGSSIVYQDGDKVKIATIR